MLMEKEECENAINVIEKSTKALRNKDMLALKELSDHTIHSSCRFQDSQSITLAVIIYALSKLVERGDFSKIKNWEKFVKKFNGTLKLAVIALNENNEDKYSDY